MLRLTSVVLWPIFTFFFSHYQKKYQAFLHHYLKVNIKPRTGHVWKCYMLFIVNKSHEKTKTNKDSANKYCLCSLSLKYLIPLCLTATLLSEKNTSVGHTLSLDDMFLYQHERGHCVKSIPHTPSCCCKYSL